MLRCRQLVIQLTDRCNARCPQCGMRVTESFARSTLPKDDVKRMLDHAAQSGVDIVSFTGGEPLLLLDDLAELINYAGQAGIRYIRSGTNGFMFAGAAGPRFESRVRKLAETLAATPLRNFWISVDSCIPSIHEEMRGLHGVVAGIEKALPIFREYGVYPTANLGINRNIAGRETDAGSEGPEGGAGGSNGFSGAAFHEKMKEAFREFYRFVIGMGFTIVNTCYPMSVEESGCASPDGLEAVYRATSTSRVVRFSNQEKALLFKALMDVIPEFRSRIRIFSPLSSLYALHGYYGNPNDLPYPCLGGIDFFYVDASDGNTYPCGYRGNEALGKFWDLRLPVADAKPDCRQCDWECFRDPSELLGPVRQIRSAPLGLLDKMKRDGRFFRTWIDDLRYYRACGFFSGRTPPDRSRLSRFRPLFS